MDSWSQCRGSRNEWGCAAIESRSKDHDAICGFNLCSLRLTSACVSKHTSHGTESRGMPNKVYVDQHCSHVPAS